MKNSTLIWIIIASCSLLSGCRSGPPSSLQAGHYNTATALELWPAAYVAEEPFIPAEGVMRTSIERQLMPNLALFNDYKVLKFSAGLKLCQDTFRLPDLSQGKDGFVEGPGQVAFSSPDVTIDEAEITNIDWRLFEALNQEAGIARAELRPDSTALPVPDYYTGAFYAYYPVVGISYEQAKRYCEWRSKVVTELLAKDLKAAQFTCEFRLPTEAEWEEAAQV